MTYWPSPSQQALTDPWSAHDGQALASEVRLIWRDPRAFHLPWLRERFLIDPTRSWPRSIRARTVDRRGRTIRVFTARDDDLEAYARLIERRKGTCPCEAVDPLTIAVGQPAVPAHLKLSEVFGGWRHAPTFGWPV